MKATIEEINSAFTPQKEVTDPKQFMGRYNEIKRGLNFLNTDGSFLLIYGLRGLGKSSLANQIEIIAKGNPTLLKMCGLDKFIPKKAFDFFVHTIKCDDYVKDISSLAKRIILGDEHNKSLYDYLKDDKQKVDKALELFAKKETIIQQQKTRSGTEDEYIISEDIVHIFRQALNVIRKDNQEKSGILILIDEFDLISDKRGFASLIKSITSDYIKFGVVGIADDINDLVTDHASIARQIEPIEIGLMIDEHLEKIISRAEEIVKNEIKFSSDAKTKIVTKAKGFPYYVHLIGKEAFLIAFEREIFEIDTNIINECEELIKSGLSNSVHETQYTLLASSSARESILRLLASDNQNHTLVENVHAKIKEMGIDKPSKYLGELTANIVGDDKAKAPIKMIKRNQFCKFNDPLFKLYVTMREPIHSDCINASL